MTIFNVGFGNNLFVTGLELRGAGWEVKEQAVAGVQGSQPHKPTGPGSAALSTRNKCRMDSKG